MSVVPQPWPQPAPQLTEAVAAMYRGKRERPLPVLVRDKLGEWLSDEQFAGAYGVRGKPGWPPSRLALVTIFQKAGNLTDRQAAEQVRTRIDWKYALGLDLADPGFDHSILSEFRARVAAGGLDQVVLDRLLERLAADGLVGAGGAMRTDSTHVISAVRDLNRLELAGESVRACLEQLAVAAPQVVAQLLDDSWAQRYAARVDTWRMPAATTRKDKLALAYGRDGRILLKAVYAAAASDPDLAFLARLRQVEVLRVVLLQNYLTVTGEQGREVIKRREADVEGLPPGRSRIASPYDTDARWGVKRDTFWNGYKIHVTETCDTAVTASDGDGDGEDTAVAPPHLIVNVETTDATVPDNQMTEPVHAHLDQRGLLPGEHLVDSGYPSAELLVSSQADYAITLVTPMLADTSPQARAGAGFDRTAFAIDSVEEAEVEQGGLRAEQCRAQRLDTVAAGPVTADGGGQRLPALIDSGLGHLAGGQPGQRCHLGQRRPLQPGHGGLEAELGGGGGETLVELAVMAGGDLAEVGAACRQVVGAWAQPSCHYQPSDHPPVHERQCELGY